MEQGLHVARQGGDDSGLARTVSEAIVERRLLALEYYKPNEDEFTERTVEPYALINGREGWYVAAFDPARDAVRHFRLDRIKSVRVTATPFEPRAEVDPARDVEGWPRTGEVEASRVARIWVSPERARWAREERRVAEELADGAVVVELPFKGTASAEGTRYLYPDERTGYIEVATQSDCTWGITITQTVRAYVAV
jgi:proteasome accessory factor C